MRITYKNALVAITAAGATAGIVGGYASMEHQLDTEQEAFTMAEAWAANDDEYARTANSSVIEADLLLTDAIADLGSPFCIVDAYTHSSLDSLDNCGLDEEANTRLVALWQARDGAQADLAAIDDASSEIATLQADVESVNPLEDAPLLAWGDKITSANVEFANPAINDLQTPGGNILWTVAASGSRFGQAAFAAGAILLYLRKRFPAA